jgi:D-amino-acid dehydrogenase
MEGIADVVVVGGGLIGTATAFEVAAAGGSAVIVDRADPGRATDAGAGILSPETSGVADDDWFAFAMAAADHYRRLVGRLSASAPGGTDHGYAPSGLLSLALDENEVPWYEERVALTMARSPGLLEEITPAEACERCPVLGEPARALYSPAAARVDGRRMAAALLRAAAANGARRLAADVTGLCLDAGKATGVETSQGTISCGAVVIAGGAWSQRFGTPLGVELPVAPTKGQIVHLQLPGPVGDSGSWPIVQPVLNFYLVPWPEGRVACGGTFEPEAAFDSRPTALGVHQLLRSALRIAPGLRDATFSEVRVGLRPTTPDELPIVGAVPGWSNVYVATGHGAEGLLLGPYSGHLVAALAHDPGSSAATAAAAVLAHFSASRFTG